jgi:hypothetical protein
MPFGIYAFPVPAAPEELEAMLTELRSLGLDTLTAHTAGAGPWRHFMDRAARHGLWFRPSLRYWDEGAPKEWRDSYPAIGADGSTLKHWVCLNQPKLRAMAQRNIGRALTEFREHLGFHGSAYYGDDLFLGLFCQQGVAKIACYCAKCRADFLAATGIEPPAETPARRGAIPPDDPWLRWLQHRCTHQYAGLIHAVEAAREAVAPEIPLGLCHGWPDNPFVSLVSGLYGPQTQLGSVVSSYAYPFLRSPAAELITHYEIARMGHRRDEIWMLGILEGDNTVVPGWQVQQNYWNMLAAGYRTVAFFSWWGIPKMRLNPDPALQARLSEAIAALGRCGRHKDWIFPSARHWQQARSPFAQLYSFTTEAFDLAPVYHGHRHSKRLASFHRQALAQQVPLEFICEEEIRTGALAQYQVICLHDVRALAGDLYEPLLAWQAAGGTLLVDEDLLYTDSWHPGMQVNLKGALHLSAESMVNYLAERASGPVRSDHPAVTIRHFQAGAADYTVLANNAPDRVTGMGYSYGDPAANYRHADLVPNPPVSTRLQWAMPGRWCFDASTGEAVGRTDDERQLTLEPAWGAVLVTLPVATAHLTCDLAYATRLGTSTPLRLALLTPTGEPLPATLTVHLELTSPTGQRHPASAYLALLDGTADLPLAFGINDEPGEWTLTLTGGLPRQTQVLYLHLEASVSPHILVQLTVVDG